MEIRGLNKKNIERISTLKKENKYFRDYRLNSYDIFTKLDNPSFGPKYNINYDEIIYYKNDFDKAIHGRINPEELLDLDHKIIQEGSPRIDGAYEVAINESSPVQFKQVEISKQNDINTPVNENIEKEPQNLNQYSPEELAAYQNQNQIQRNANAYEEEIEQYNQPDDTPNKKNVEENNIIKQNQEVQQSNISNISNTGAIDLAVLTSQKSAAPIIIFFKANCSFVFGSSTKYILP